MITHKIFLSKKLFFNGKSHLCGISENFIFQVLLSVEMKANLICMECLDSNTFSIYISKHPHS